VSGKYVSVSICDAERGASHFVSHFERGRPVVVEHDFFNELLGKALDSRVRSQPRFLPSLAISCHLLPSLAISCPFLASFGLFWPPWQKFPLLHFLRQVKIEVLTRFSVDRSVGPVWPEWAVRIRVRRLTGYWAQDGCTSTVGSVGSAILEVSAARGVRTLRRSPEVLSCRR
jgi:hypothetical protein